MQCYKILFQQSWAGLWENTQRTWRITTQERRTCSGRSKQERDTYIKSIGGRKNKSDWFRKDGTSTMATVPTTPAGLLAKQMTASLAACPAPGNCKTKLIEGGGLTVKQNLVRGKPFPRQSCGREDCILDKYSEGG